MAEAGSDGLPFIGSLMSLVSHGKRLAAGGAHWPLLRLQTFSFCCLPAAGDIRYEGVLYTIDMPNSTIALSNGKSDRRGS